MTSHTFPEATLHFTHAGKLATIKAKLRPPLLLFGCHKVVSQCGVSPQSVLPNPVCAGRADTSSRW